MIAWIGLAVEMTGMLTLASTIGQFIAVAVTVASSTALVAGVLAVRSARRDAPRPM